MFVVGWIARILSLSDVKYIGFEEFDLCNLFHVPPPHQYLAPLGCASVSELRSKINKSTAGLRKALGDAAVSPLLEAPGPEGNEEEEEVEADKYPLLSLPDSELTAEQVMGPRVHFIRSTRALH